MSIWGNAITLGGSGGGSGPSASDAILTVTVPTGSTVTAVKGGVTLTPTMWVQAADATLDCALFVISPSLFDSQNAWTVTATLVTDTASDTVTIDRNEQYNIFISFNLYLVRNGVLLVPVTSGTANAIVEETAEGLKIQYQGGAYSARAYWELTSLLLGGVTYRTINVNVKSWSNVANNDSSSIAVNTKKDTGGEVAMVKAYGTTFPGVLTLDVLNIALPSKYFYIRVSDGGGTAYINDLYLSR